MSNRTVLFRPSFGAIMQKFKYLFMLHFKMRISFFMYNLESRKNLNNQAPRIGKKDRSIQVFTYVSGSS